ncbi:hypothetical protein B0T18DRAFT_488186 [Schizothecium vesticola]|uniref:Uncharacterized protein n=1 Tax=Schizothecium vesticola TaxID=314040 RepID=A0AA40K8Z5_9PEZI|nr:hypothetical protein B0T18DRAFT_488186 [Schizothecium vesticola]
MTDSDQNPPPPSSPCITWDRSDPAQQELSALINLKHDASLRGIFSLGRDGVVRSLTADRRVVDAVGLTPEQLALWINRWPEALSRVMNQLEEGADGTKVPREQWFSPPEGILPPPMTTEVKEREEKIRKEKDEKNPGWLERTREEMRGKGMSELRRRVRRRRTVEVEADSYETLILILDTPKVCPVRPT